MSSIQIGIAVAVVVGISAALSLDAWTRPPQPPDRVCSRRRYAVITLLLSGLFSHLFRYTLAFATKNNGWTSEWERLRVQDVIALGVILVLYAFFMAHYTLRRLRDAGWPETAAFFLLLPWINVFFVLLLWLEPSTADRPGSLGRALLPRSELGSAVAGILGASLLGTPLVLLSVKGFGSYGWVLFLVLPLTAGLISVLFYGATASRSFGRCLGVAALSMVTLAVALLAFAIEGIICILMALPIALPLAVLGGVLG